MQRRVTKQIHVGDIAIGGNAPVSVQSMTSGYTYEIDTCVAEINRLAKAGASAAWPQLGNQTINPFT